MGSVKDRRKTISSGAWVTGLKSPLRIVSEGAFCGEGYFAGRCTDVSNKRSESDVQRKSPKRISVYTVPLTREKPVVGLEHFSPTGNSEHSWLSRRDH